MDILELRIGNKVLYHRNESIQEIETVTGLMSDGTIFLSPDHEGCTHPKSLKTIRPIQLTEEWLLKLQFAKSMNVFWTKCGVTLLMKGLTKDKFYDFLFGGSCQEGWSESTSIKYVHELQNIYFALTGKELDIK